MYSPIAALGFLSKTGATYKSWWKATDACSTVTFPKDQTPPVNGFWSLTLYNEHHFFAKNELSRYSLGTKEQRPEIQPRRLAYDLRAGGATYGCTTEQLAASAARRRFLTIRPSLLAEGRGSRWRMDTARSAAGGRHRWPSVMNGRVSAIGR